MKLSEFKKKFGDVTRLLASYCSEPIVYLNYGDGNWFRVDGNKIWGCKVAPTDRRLLSILLIFISLVILFFIAFQPSQILVIFALGLLPYIAWMVPKELSLDVTKPAIGVLAGGVVVGTNLVAGVGGPLLDVFFQRVDMTRYQVVATKAIAQTIGHISKIIFFGGLVVSFSFENWPNPVLLIFAIIFSVIGTTLGKKVLDIIDDEIFFRWTQIIVLSVGTVFIIRGLFLLSQ